jgi:TonB family protein
MIKIRFLLLFLFIGSTAFAQRQNLYFLKNNGQYVKLRDSADYLRIVKEPEAGSELYVVNEHYLDGTNKTIGYSSKIDPPVYEGQYISYFKNGKKRLIGTYKKGKLVDTAFSFYPNGVLYMTTVYATTVNGGKEKEQKYIKSVQDSTGKALVVDGNGECKIYDADFNMGIERGSIKNGQYEGEWIGGTSIDKPTYKETYANGELISGESFDKDGTVYQYTKVYISPQFKGGMDKFYNYLKKTIRYPEECLRSRTQGKVILKFIVKKDGSIQNIKVMNLVHPELAKEAVRVTQASPLWEPGTVRGKPSNIAFNVPVSFSLR